MSRKLSVSGDPNNVLMHSHDRCLESLPSSWLAELVAKLPAHLKLQLRQCSKHMQQLVDASGLQLRLHKQPCAAQAAALQLCGQQLATLDIASLCISSNHTSTQSDQPSFTPVFQAAAIGLPCLRQLVCDAAQVQLLVALAGNSSRLTHLKLCSNAVLAAQDKACWKGLHQQLPSLASSLRCLEMTTTAHLQFTKQPCMWPAVGACTGLHSLLLHMAKPKGYGIAHCKLSEQAWQAAVQPLTLLTRLEMGTRVPYSPDSDPTRHDSMLAAGLPLGTAVSEDKCAANSTAAACSSSDGSLARLQHLRCYGFDGDAQDSWGLSWVCSYSSLTGLDLLLASAGEVDFEALAQLQQLRSLEIHCYPDELFTSSQLAPLAICSQLTCLRLDSLVIEAGHGAAAAVVAVGEQQHALTAAVTAGTNEPGRAADVVLPQLPSLLKLAAGVLCKAPMSEFAPNLTQLRDLDYDLAQLELSSSFINEQPPAGQEPLAQLTALQLLAVNIHSLVRHAAYPSLTQLASLRELHIDMVGNLTDTCISSGGGLPTLPHLTRLVMTIAPQAGHNLQKTYSTEEDVLLWQSQHAVQNLRLRGSRLLGGFLVHRHLLELLPQKLQQLRCIELVKCSDLTLQDLAALVKVKAAPRILVQRCAGISDKECVELQEGCRNGVAVDYCM